MALGITASAPGKLLLFGEHAVVYGSPCIVSAVNQRLFVTVTLNGENVFHLSAPDLGLTAYSKNIDTLGGKGLPTGVRFIEVLYKRFLATHPQIRGIDVVTKSDFSSSFGFGSSSAATVAFAKALFTAYNIPVDKRRLFEICYQTVLEVQGVGSGFDVASAIWGGTLYYVSPGKVIEPLVTGNLPLVVGYTGVKADTPTLVRQVAEHRRRQPKIIQGLFSQITTIATRAREALLVGDFKTVGFLMNENQLLLNELGVSSAKLDLLNKKAVEAGAWGAKLSGAGGGDCMIAVSPMYKNDPRQSKTERRKIEKEIDCYGELMKVDLGAEGVRLEEDAKNNN